MSSDNQWEKMFKAILEMPQKVVRNITTGVARIFSPNDDDYPATGVQPFEGEPNEEGNISK
jgi:nucleoid-associated protein YgaU